MAKIILNIGGMSCSACSTGLEKYLNKQEGIINANVNLVLAQASIEYDSKLTVSDLERFVKEAGFESLGIYSEKNISQKTESKKALVFFGILAFFILYISMAHMSNLPSLPYLDMMHYPLNYALCLLLLVLPFFIYGFSIFKSGLKNALHKTPNMDTLVSLGVMASFIYSLYSLFMLLKGHSSYVTSLYFESCALIIYFLKVGRFIDYKSKEKTKEALKELVQITPKTALLKTKDSEKEVTIDEVKPQDILICKPGMKVAVDGTITKGTAYFDEAFITGESKPSKKSVSNKVIAGSINLDGYIEYSAERIGKDSTISEIVHLVVEATNTKAPIQKLADKVSGYFVPTIIIIACLTFIGYVLFGFQLNEALTSFVTVLVVACPCALGLATPLAIVVSEGVCAKNGILVKNSSIIEEATNISNVVFDKTGTLTYGKLQIAKIINYSDENEEDLLTLIASLEAKSTHPIATAFANYTKEHKLSLQEVTNFKNIPGIGLQGTINKQKVYAGSYKFCVKLKVFLADDDQVIADELENLNYSLVYLIVDNKIKALVGIKDTIRDNAKKAIKKLENERIKVGLLTGDNETNAKLIGHKLGITMVISDVLPQEKTEAIKELLAKNKKVMMVGDGINDAPSLATATIGVSFNSATDIAADSSDIILMNDNLEKIPDFLTISKKTLKIIKQNLFWAFFYNICMLPLAIGLFKPLGLSMNPMFGSLAMTFSSLTVVLNSLRIKKWQPRKKKRRQ